MNITHECIVDMVAAQEDDQMDPEMACLSHRGFDS
jgi:hypothetical protein